MNLNELIEEIDSRRIGTNWILPFEELTEWIDLSKEEIIKILYLENSYHLTLSLNGFTQENISDLITLLKIAGYNNVEKHFFSAGYYFSHSNLDLWSDFFQSVVSSKIQNADIDEQLFEDSFYSSPDFKSAALFYCQSFFEVDEFIDFALDLFISKYKIKKHHLTIKLLKDHIQSLFQRKVLDWQNFFTIIFPGLNDFAIKRGLASVKSGLLLYEVLPFDYLENHQILDALKILQVKEADTFEAVRFKYLKQLKLVHPDIDPDGLEKTRQLIESWKLLESFKKK